MLPVGGFRSDTVDQIRRFYEDEARNPPIPRHYGDIPISYDVITTDWLTATLARDCKNAVVKNFTLGPEDNGSANRRRIVIEWEGADADKLPTSVFCKAAHSLENRIILSVGGTYSETCFYNEIRPKMDIEAPWAYYAGYNPESWAAIIMLKDMSASTTFCNHKTLLSKEQFAEQVQMLAKVHGTFYRSKEPFFERLLAYRQRFQNLINVGIESACCNGFRAAKGVIPTRLFEREDEIWPATLKSVERNYSLPPTVVHGDVHLGNWYITPEGHMGLTDWQAMARGHWSRDLAYVMGTAVPAESRRLWEQEIVELYVAELEKAGGPKTSVEEAWFELRRQSLGALAYWTLTLTPSEAMPDMQTEAASLDFISRICTLMDDHDVLDAFDF
ncbi:unnamed protein product [Clonostachys byssicola]|uniref:Aminoglycoside phosphotransferase domain-containing protein n=1 Tax=Clonostachys byssicola TaxID=160290 RepID=A0A9N9U8V9_9HYPO|nr:unnamed protein product [Clonostachys byssicola]